MQTTALLTDRYELTMLQAARHSGMADRRCVFEVFTRRLPLGRNFGVVAGTGRILEQIKNFNFDQQTLAWLERERVVDAATLNWLSNYRFTGNISGYREGDLYFAYSPVLTVESTFAEAVLLETLILSIFNYDSSVATAAARMRIVAGNRGLAEMGSRRVNENAAVACARAAYIGGFDATSNLEAGRSYGVPTMGTAGHAFTLLHDTEEQAFRAQLETLGDQTTLLVDTYDIEAAIRKAIAIAPNLGAIRIDSGDLKVEVAKARTLLDSLGATGTKITVTNDLDEKAIAALKDFPVDAYGVGTSIATGGSVATAGFVYKLVSFQENDGTWSTVAKKSQDKTNYGGRKNAVRELVNGKAAGEHIGKVTAGENSRELIVNLASAGVVDDAFTAQAGTKAAKEFHRSIVAEIPFGDIPTVFS